MSRREREANGLAVLEQTSSHEQRSSRSSRCAASASGMGDSCKLLTEDSCRGVRSVLSTADAQEVAEWFAVRSS